MRRKAKWFVRRESDGRMLCTDGKWRSNAGGVEFIKFYSSDWRAIKFGLKYEDGTAFAVYDGEWIDCCGHKVRMESFWFEFTPSESINRMLKLSSPARVQAYDERHAWKIWLEQKIGSYSVHPHDWTCKLIEPVSQEVTS